MKKILILFIFVCAILVAMAMTVPDEEAHRQAIRKALIESVQKEIGQGNIAGKLVGKMLDTKVVDEIMDKVLTVGLDYHNHIFWSTTSYSLLGDKQTLTIGLFGVVLPAQTDKDLQLLGDD